MKKVSIEVLEEMLKSEQEYKIDPRDYISWGETDETSYKVAEGKREAKIEILKELIYLSE